MNKQSNMNRLKNNICDVLKEQQIKLGYQKESVRLYYPLQSLNRFLQSEYNEDQMQQFLTEYARNNLKEFGNVTISHKKDRFCFYLPDQASQWVHDNTQQTGFLYDFIQLISRHDITIEDILACFYKYSDHVHFEKMTDQEFDYCIYFEDGKPDAYRYCLTEEGHFIYHRFVEEDYLDFLI